MTAKKKPTTSAAASDALDLATELHNNLTQLSQTVPPQVNMHNVLTQAAQLRNILEGHHAEVEAPADETTA